MLIATNGRSELVHMSLYGAFAWFDEELEPQASSSAVFARLGFPCRVLSDIEAEESETRFTRKRIARVSDAGLAGFQFQDRKSTRLNSSHSQISYAVFCLKKKKKKIKIKQINNKNDKQITTY